MEFDPQSGMLKCPYCGRTRALATAGAAIAENDYEQFLLPDPSRLRRLAENALQVTCSGCGSTVTFEPPEVAGACPFCGAKIVAQPRAADPLIAPEGVLPFLVTQKEATASIRNWLRTRWFAPSALKQMARQGDIGGVYIPFWTYDAQTFSRYRGERGEHYWETEYYTETDANGRAVQKTRQVQKTRWYPASGQVSRFFDDVLVSATKALPRPKLDALQPWDLPAVRPYDPAFLSGFKAQRYQIELGEGFGIAKEVMAGVIHGDVARDIGGDEQRIHSVDTRYSGITFKHLLLPIWVSAYRFERKVFQVVVNARTGEVQGDRPYSIWKIAFLVLVILLAILLFFYLRSPEGSGIGG
jgi:ribosomal protein S27E